MFIAGLLTIAKTWKQSNCPALDEWIKMSVYICVCIYVYMYMYIYIYMHTHNEILFSHKNEENQPFLAHG